MQINIIGGSGFIGTKLATIFQQKKIAFSIIDKVTSQSFPDLTHVADIRSLDRLRSLVDFNSVLINLAAEHRDDVTPRSLYYEVNIKGAQNLCTVANEKSVNTIIFTSSVAVYGFAQIGTDESGEIAPFNDYGRTKWEAEQVYLKWQHEDPKIRTLVIVRPTVVFGERNRGNVYNLLRQISSGKFLMIGNGLNRKSLAYVHNIAAFLDYSLIFKPGVHIYNYADKPDFTMNMLVGNVRKLLGKSSNIKFRLPFSLGLLIGFVFDLIAKISGKQLSVSSIRVKKFCSNSVYGSTVELTGFIPPVPLVKAIENTVRFEFIEDEVRSGSGNLNK